MHLQQEGPERYCVMDNLVRGDPDGVGKNLPVRVLLPDDITLERLQAAERLGRAAGNRLTALLHSGVS